MTTVEQLTKRLARLLGRLVPFVGVVYRSSTPKYATETDLMTGEGSRREGGRWNSKGIAAVYASLTPETALAETLAHHKYYGIPIYEAMPRTFVAIDVNLTQVLDLRTGDIRRRIQMSESRILSVDWRAEARAGREPITQALGRAAHESGVEGLVVPSATAGNGHNLLVFPSNLCPSSRMTIVHAERLTR